MTNNGVVSRIATVLSDNNSISICLPNNPTLDAVAAGTALYMALTKMGKSVGLAASEDIDQTYGLSAQDKIQQNLVADGKDLVVSFPYSEGSVDKVTYNIEGDRFNLVIQPREGSDRLESRDVNFSHTGGKPEVVVAIYAPTLNALGSIYTKNKDQFTGIDIINIDRHFTNSNYGSLNYVDKKSASMSQMVLGVLQALKAELDKDIATNLYAGIAAATNNFSAHSVNADTFETIALLMRNGAVKKPVMQQRQPLQRPPLQQRRPIAQGGFQPQFGQQQPMQQQPMQNQQPFGGQQMAQPAPAQSVPAQPIPTQPIQPKPRIIKPQQQVPEPQPVQSQTDEFQTMQEDLDVDQEIPMPSESDKEPENVPEKEVVQVSTGPEMEPQFIENKEKKKPKQSSDDQESDNETNGNSSKKDTPQDWLKPKIFKGGKKNLV